jgi:hypothetical protein
MKSPSKPGEQANRGRPVTPADVLQVCGELDDAKVLAIVEAEPTYEDLEEAAAWAADEGDPLREMARPLSGKAAQVYQILETELGERDERDRS